MLPSNTVAQHTDEFKENFLQNLRNAPKLSKEIEEMGAVRCFHCYGEGEVAVVLHSKECIPGLSELEPSYVCICPVEEIEACVFCRGTGEMLASERDAYGNEVGPGPRINKFSNKSRREVLLETATYIVDLSAKLDLKGATSILSRHKTAESAAHSLRKKNCVVESRAAVTPMKDEFGSYETFCFYRGSEVLGGLVRRYELENREIPKIVFFEVAAQYTIRTNSLAARMLIEKHFAKLRG